MSEPLWRPDAERVATADLTAFMQATARRTGRTFDGYRALHRWSIDAIPEFWETVWDHCGVIAAERGERTLIDADAMPGARFFPDARLNFAENLLVRDGNPEALVFHGEEGAHERLSRAELRRRVAALAAAMRERGIVPGDRVAAFIPNIPEAMVGMLAAASVGAVWTSCSPDFGSTGVIDRFGQVEPKLLLCADGYTYRGRRFESLPRVAEFLPQLPSLEQVWVASYLADEPDLGTIEGAETIDSIIQRHTDAPESFEQLPFNAPLYVLYSSGTTGPPKCIVHGAGGTLLKHLVEHRLLCDVRSGDRVFYFTTCGWMMWNWLASALASEATLLLYDGDPMYPEAGSLFGMFDREEGSLFGTSAKYLDALRHAGYRPADHHRLGALRTLTSTGSPLVAEGFDWVYEAIKRDVCLSSISGGTDIVGCFVGGNPIGPVRRGEIQALSLGMAVDVWDDDGNSLRGEKGELVCTRPFPSMPLGFWDDPDDARYRAAYFERYPGVWHHGDFAEITEHDGVVIYGRSDATLNPGGVRIGTAEIYRVVEGFDQVEEAVVVGQDHDDDVRIVLFVKLASGAVLDDALIAAIRSRIRTQCSPRHVPARVLQVPAIPRTKSGKIVELAVREVIHGRPVRNLEALANPEALDHFADRPELSSD